MVGKGAVFLWGQPWPFSQEVLQASAGTLQLTREPVSLSFPWPLALAAAELLLTHGMPKDPSSAWPGHP